MDDLKAEIARVRALCDAATPGPWYHSAVGEGPVPLYSVWSSSKFSTPDGVFHDTLVTLHKPCIPLARDAAFIAASRTLVPRLLAALELAIEQRDSAAMRDWDGYTAYSVRSSEFNAAILSALRGES